MQYRKLGNTGLEVSALGFGCMRLPKVKGNPQLVDRDASVALFKRAFELGVNYFDTAYLYDNGDSERALGCFLKEVPREKVIISDKNPVGHQFWQIPGNEAPASLWRRCLEEMLIRLDTDYIDICHFHDTQMVTFRILVMAHNGLMEQALKAKEEGLIRHIGFSSHDSPFNIIRMIEMAKGAIEAIIIQYNLLDRRNEPVIDYCREHGIGVAIMGPVGGGRLMHPSEVYQKAIGARSTPEVALRFVLSNPGVSTAMSGMNALKQLEENVAVASEMQPLSTEERTAIDRIQKENERLLNLYCTGCNYCMPCPNGVNIPGNFTAMNLLKVHGLVELAKRQYEGLGEGKAENCIECGECVGKCPQKIDIPTRIKEVAETFASLEVAPT